MFHIGGSGALCIDEKMNISAFVQPDAAVRHTFDNTLFAIADDKGRVRELSKFEKVKAKPCFLGCNYKFSDSEFPVKVSATVVTPFDFGKDAHLPAAVFSFKIKNASKKRRIYHFAILAENVLENAFHEDVTGEVYRGVILGSATALSVQTEYMTHCILSEQDACVVRYMPRENTKEAFLAQLRSGSFMEMDYTMPAARDCASIYHRFALEPDESRTIQMVYTWYLPNVCIMQDKAVSLKDADVYAYSNVEQLASYVYLNRAHLLKAAEVLSDAMKELDISKIIERAAFDDCQAAIYCMPLKYSEPSKTKLFYKNAYASSDVFLLNDIESVFPSGVYFDYEREAETVKWALEHCVEDDGRYVGLPKLDCENNDGETDIFVQLSMIWRIYRLYIMSGDASIMADAYFDLVKILDYIKKIGWVRENEAIVTAVKHEFYDAACMSNAYILALLCMQKIAEVLERKEDAFIYGRLAMDGQGYVKRNFFNGRFFTAQNVTEDENELVCTILQLLPMQIGDALGIEVVDHGQLSIALESIYTLNFVTNEENGLHGVKLFSDREIFNRTAEVGYAQLLLKSDMSYLAALVLKAMYLRETEQKDNFKVSMLMQATTDASYDAVTKTLHIGKRSGVFFLKNAIMIVECKMNVCIRLFGESVDIKHIDYAGNGIPVSARLGRMELLYTGKDNLLSFGSAVLLDEENEIIVQIKNKSKEL